MQHLYSTVHCVFAHRPPGSAVVVQPQSQVNPPKPGQPRRLQLPVAQSPRPLVDIKKQRSNTDEPNGIAAAFTDLTAKRRLETVPSIEYTYSDVVMTPKACLSQPLRDGSFVGYSA